jgi:hypothetical protein
MRKRLGQIALIAGLVTIMAAPAWAGRGGGGGGDGQGGGAGWDISPSNKQSDEDATRALERAEQRRAEQAGEHARSGEHDMNMQKEKMKEKAKAKGDDAKEKYDRDRDRDMDRERMHDMAEPKEKMKEKEKAKGAADDMRGDMDMDRDRDRVMDKTKEKANEGKMTGNGKGEQAPDEAATGKKRWWWPFDK